MAEEHGFQAQEGHRLCANNCGFFGNLTSSDLCSKCQRDFRMKEEQNAIAKSAFDDNNNSAKHSPASPSLMPAPLTSSIIIPTLKLPEAATTATAAERADLPAPNRCGSCRKRVGLTGFKCRCGSTFCGSHRYAEQHGCRFDYKAMAKDAIAKANPVVKAAKLQRI